MIKANELRQNNIVNVFDGQSMKQGLVKTITDSLKCVVRIGNEWKPVKYCNLEPIPLTEEWLLKFGFVFKAHKMGTNGIYSNGKMNLVLSNSGNVYTTRNKLIPYVHIFQNHYYFTLLTGEELKTKDDE